VVNVVQKLGHLPVIKKYLETIQEKDIREVNNALHDLYIDEEDFESLRSSVSKFQNFDSLGLAKRLSSNDLLEFKRIASQLYKQNKRWKQSIELSKSNKLYKDAMDTAAESKDREVAEELLQFFVDPNSHISNPHQCFAACLYTCYELIRPDLALELAWRHKMLDFVFPYFIQYLKDVQQKIDDMHTLHQGPHGQSVGVDPIQQPSPLLTAGMLGVGIPTGSLVMPPRGLVGPSGVVPSGVVPSGVVPTGVVPTVVGPTGPTGIVPTGMMPTGM